MIFHYIHTAQNWKVQNYRKARFLIILYMYRKQQIYEEKQDEHQELPRKTDVVDNSQYVLQAWDKYTHQCTRFDSSNLH